MRLLGIIVGVFLLTMTFSLFVIPFDTSYVMLLMCVLLIG
jgi:hypothetical protein